MCCLNASFSSKLKGRKRKVTFNRVEFNLPPFFVRPHLFVANAIYCHLNECKSSMNVKHFLKNYVKETVVKLKVFEGFVDVFIIF